MTRMRAMSKQEVRARYESCIQSTLCALRRLFCLDAINWTILATFFVLTLVRVLQHAMWRDECHPWLMGRYSTSFLQLYDLTQYEGHPFCWYACLRILSLLGFDYHAMQVFHALVATASVFIVLRFSPFTRLINTLLAFGYFPFFEYAIISREYALGVLLLFITCAVYRRALDRPILFSVCLFLLAQTSAYMLILAGGFQVAHVVRAFHSRADNKHGSRLPDIYGIMIFACGAVLALVQLAPTHDAAAPPFSLGDCFAQLTSLEPFTRFWAAYCPLPALTPGYWNTNFLDPFPTLQKVLCMLLFAGVPLVFFHNRAAMMFLLSCEVVLLLFHCYFPSAALRHAGAVFLALVATYWISCPSRNGHDSAPNKTPSLKDRCLSIGFAILLGGHVSAGALVSAAELAQPFSGGKLAARYIQKSYPADIPIIVDVGTTMTPLITYLDRPVFCASNRAWQTYWVSNTQMRGAPLPPEEIAGAVLSFLESSKKDVLLVTNYWPVYLPNTITATPVFQSLGAVSGECCFVVHVRYNKLLAR